MCITRSVVRLFYQLCITPSVVRYLVTCVTFCQFASYRWKLGITWSVVQFSASSVSFSGLHDNAVSYVLLSHLCTSPSAVHYSVSCALLDQLCITQSVVSDRSVVLHSVSWMIIPSVVYYSVSCVLFHHLCITPLDEFNPVFRISIFETLSNFTQLQVTQLIVLLSRKFFQTWQYYPQNC